jgi:hypothetical protein
MAHPVRAGDRCIAGFPPGLCRLGVKSGKARSEHIPSGLPPRADIVDALWQFRFVPRADIRQTHPIRRRRANGFSGSGADRSGVLALIAATETLLAIHLRPVELGSVPKAIKFILHAPPDLPSARSQFVEPLKISRALGKRQVQCIFQGLIIHAD